MFPIAKLVGGRASAKVTRASGSGSRPSANRIQARSTGSSDGCPNAQPAVATSSRVSTRSDSPGTCTPGGARSRCSATEKHSSTGGTSGIGSE
jgi:hypothetical protein